MTIGNTADTQIVGKFELMRQASDIIRQESEALQNLAKNLPVEFYDAVELMRQCKGAVIVTGVGKAGWIGQKLSASFASTGTRSHFVHPSEAVHGDLGRIANDDLVLALSNSGESAELLQILPTLDKANIPVVSITAIANSTLAKHSRVTLAYGKTVEAGHLGLAPSTSTTLMLALGDALVLVLSGLLQFKPTDFARFHPGGNLGKKLSLVDEIMRPLADCRVALETETIRDIYIRLSGRRRRVGAILVLNDAGALVGLFTDSDLARLLEQEQDSFIDEPIANVMTREPSTIQSGARTMMAVEILACRNFSELPVVDSGGRPVGLIDITDVVGLTSGPR